MMPPGEKGEHRQHRERWHVDPDAQRPTKQRRRCQDPAPDAVIGRMELLAQALVGDHEVHRHGDRVGQQTVEAGLLAVQEQVADQQVEGGVGGEVHPERTARWPPLAAMPAPPARR